MHQTERANLKRAADEAQAELRTSGWHGEVTQDIRHGNAGEAIVQAVADHGADIVVMSTHGRSGLRRALLGSVADHVLRHVRAGIPVLFVRE